jgi:hypothetical protein
MYLLIVDATAFPSDRRSSQYANRRISCAFPRARTACCIDFRRLSADVLFFPFSRSGRVLLDLRASAAFFCRFSLPLVAACCLLAKGGAAAAQITSSANTFVSAGTPNGNLGALPISWVGAGSTSYVRFDLSSIPAKSTDNGATLVLDIAFVASNGEISLYRLTDLCCEGTLDELNAPLLRRLEISGVPPVEQAIMCEQLGTCTN